MNKSTKEQFEKIYGHLDCQHEKQKAELLSKLPSVPPTKSSYRKAVTMKIFKIAGTTSIAAALIAMITMLVLSNSATKLSAAEVFAQVQKNYSDYEGWICVYTDMNTKPKQDYILTNTRTKLFIYVNYSQNNGSVMYFDSQNNTYMYYNAKYNTVYENYISPQGAREIINAIKRTIYPENMIKEYKDLSKLNITQEIKDGSNILSLTVTHKDQNANIVPDKMTIRADIQTKLIHQIDSYLPNNIIVTSTVKYEPPEIDCSSIYNFGVPEDADIIDAGMSDVNAN